jgi:hypothetical protein
MFLVLIRQSEPFPSENLPELTPESVPQIKTSAKHERGRNPTEGYMWEHPLHFQKSPKDIFLGQIQEETELTLMFPPDMS